MRTAKPDTIVEIQFTEDTRTVLELPPVQQILGKNGLSLRVRDDDYFDRVVEGGCDVENCELVGKTVSEFVENYRKITIAAPGYYSDSAKAGKDALVYKISVVAQE